MTATLSVDAVHAIAMLVVVVAPLVSELGAVGGCVSDVGGGGGGGQAAVAAFSSDTAERLPAAS